jgi:hypothetical protein
MFNADTVLLAGEPGLNMVGGAKREIRVLVSHFGDRPIRDGTLAWSLAAGEETLAQGEKKDVSAPCYEVTALGAILLDLPKVESVRRGTLRARLERDGQTVENRWPVWIVPDEPRMPEEPAVRLVGSGLEELKRSSPHAPAADRCEGAVCVSVGMPPEGIEYVASGGRLLCFALSPPFPLEAGGLLPESGQGERVGTAISPHPLFRNFPHDGYCDWGFGGIVATHKLNLNAWLPKIEPIIWSLPDRKGFLYELAAGKGRLLLCSLNLPASMRASPLSRCLYAEMANYLAGGVLPKAQEVEPEILRKMLSSPPPANRAERTGETSGGREPERGPEGADIGSKGATDQRAKDGRSAGGRAGQKIGQPAR